MSENKTVLLKVELDIAGLKKNSDEAEKKLAILTDKQKALKAQNQQGTVEYAKLSNEIRAVSKQLKDNASAIEINDRLNKKNTGSIVEMRESLKAGVIAYNNLTKEQRENSEEGKRLQEQNLALKKSINEQEEAVGNFTGSVGNYAKGILGLKQELKELKGQMAGLDAGSEEYQKASIRAGELGDKIKEVNENVKASTGGTGFEKMSNNLGLIKGDLENLDFEGVSEKMKQMATISKSMTFGEAVGGLKNMGSALLNLGKAILANPLFLMVGAIVAIVGALKMWNDSVEQEAIEAQENHLKAIDRTIAGMERMKDKTNTLNDLYLENAKLQGATEKQLGEQRLKNFDDQNQKDIELKEAHERKLASLRSKWIKSIGEENEKENEDKFNAEVEVLDAIQFQLDTFGIRRKNLVAEINNNVESETKSHNEKIKALNEKRFADALALERRLNDLILEGRTLSYEDEKQQLEAKYLFLTDSAKNNSKDLLDLEEQKLIEFQDLNNKHRQLEIDSVKEDYRRQIEDAKTSKKERELLIENRNKAIKNIEDKYRIDSKKADTDFANFKKETEEKIQQETIASKQKIAILEAEINLEKAKGTKDEFSAWASLQQEKFRVLEENYKLDLEKYKDNIQAKELIQKQFEKDELEIQNATYTQKSELSDKEVEKTKEQKKSEALAIVNSAQQLADSLFQIQQNQIQAELNKDSDKYNQKQALLQQQLDAGIISQAEFNAQKSKFDSDYAKKESELKKQQFEKNKQAQLINAIIATATGVAQALPNLVLAGIAGALGAVQIATIVSQPTPKFEKGGVFGGKSHSAGGTKGYFDDGTQIEVEKDEAFFILNKRSSAMISQLSSLNELGGGVSFFKKGGGMSFASGGAVGLNSSMNIQNRYDMQNQLIRAVQMMPNPVVAVQDINDGVRNYVNLVSRAEF